MTLNTLLDRALVSEWNRKFWFSSAKLVHSTLLVSDKDDCGGIERQFSERLRAVLPELGITFSPHSAEKVERPASPRPSAFKKAWRGELGPKGSQGDLL
jgi:hypothetical protein